MTDTATTQPTAPGLPLPEGPQVGQEAPDFALTDQFGRTVRLSDFRGDKNVVLVFFPFAFTPTCTGELCTIRDERGDFENDDVVTLGISCDAGPSLKVFAEREGLEYPLLSDFWPHGAVSQAYGVFLESRGMAARGTFIVDKAGVLRWKVVNSPADARSTQEYRDALAAL
ncbi:MAG TPA: peroxiredoxin [Motilibacteraceae bacterium]|nr:peroxiredoxin [Motilibacteraceae bacterium]